MTTMQRLEDNTLILKTDFILQAFRSLCHSRQQAKLAPPDSTYVIDCRNSGGYTPLQRTILALSNGTKELFWIEGATHMTMYGYPRICRSSCN